MPDTAAKPSACQTLDTSEVLKLLHFSRPQLYKLMGRERRENPFPVGMRHGKKMTWRATTVARWLEEEEYRARRKFLARAAG